ncbi:MAG: ABC transporter substrate-binding protein [Actinomycetota bacterium]
MSLRSRRVRRLLGVLVVASLSGSCIQAVLEDVSRPAPRGTLRIGYPEEPVSLDPIRAVSPAERDLLRPLLPSFFLVTPELAYEPYLLAEEPTVEVSGDRMVITFRIRDGARWSDGRPISVQDVRFTWKVMTDPNLPVADRHGFEFLRGVERESDRIGRLVISPPYAGWRDLFSAGRFVLPEHVTESDPVGSWDRGPPVTAGPFVVDRWRRGLALVLEHDPMFFGPNPLAERVRVLFVPDASTAVDLLERERLDALAPMLGVGWAHQLMELPGVVTDRATGPWLVHAVTNPNAGLDAGIRRRVANAIDRRRFADVLVRGDGRLANSLLAPGQIGYEPAWRRYRPRKATVLTGVPPITLIYPQSELLILAARFLQTQLGRAGVVVELIGLDPSMFWGDWLPQGRFDVALWETRSGAFPWLDRWVDDGGTSPTTRFSDRRVDAQLGDAAEGAEYDPTELAAAERRLARLVPLLPLFQPTATVAAREGVTGIQANASVDGTFWNAWNWSLGAS